MPPAGRILVIRETRDSAVAELLGIGTLQVWIGDALSGFNERDQTLWVCRGVAVVAVITAEAEQSCWGPALWSDYVAVEEGSLLRAMDSPEVLAAAVRRCGGDVRRAILQAPLSATDLIDLGLADTLVPPGADPVEWARSWVSGRSAPALASAAMLLRNQHGGAILERSEFARLFSTGEPQEGLRRFLAKQPLDFSATTEWEIR